MRGEGKGRGGRKGELAWDLGVGREKRENNRYRREKKSGLRARLWLAPLPISASRNFGIFGLRAARAFLLEIIGAVPIV